MASNILVVDDSTTIQKMIHIALTHAPYEITDANSIDEALRRLDDGLAPLAIIADIGLAAEGGVEAFAPLADREIPIILLMGSYDAVDDEAFRTAGYRYFLKKPFDPEILIRRLEEAVGQQRPPVAPTPSRPAAFSPGSQKNVWDVLTDPRPDSDEDEMFSHLSQVDLPPLPEIDASRRGRPAFSGADPRSEDTSPNNQTPGKNSGAPGGSGPLGEELVALVEEAVLRYCRENFDRLAREVITSELQRLTKDL